MMAEALLEAMIFSERMVPDSQCRTIVPIW